MNYLNSSLYVRLTNSLKPDRSKKNIYLGVGVCARSRLSEYIPFDMFSLILCAEHFRRSVNAEKVYYIIADTHAMLTGHDPKEVIQKTLTLSKFLNDVFKKWNIPHTDLISSFISHIDYTGAKKASADKKYMEAEIIDMYHFIDNYQVGYKLGWKYSKNKHSAQQGYDEWYFDKQARKLNVPLDYCYIHSGYTMNDNAPTASPYICLDPKYRITLKDNELAAKLMHLYVSPMNFR